MRTSLIIQEMSQTGDYLMFASALVGLALVIVHKWFYDTVFIFRSVGFIAYSLNLFTLFYNEL